MIQRNIEYFLLALSFYTRLPSVKNLDYTQLPHATVYLPLIGGLVGGLSAIILYVTHFLWSPIVSILLSVIAGTLITGAFHEDGFADVCDGFGGGYDKTQILAIMKDSAIGVYGALGLGLLVILKINILMSFPFEQLPFILIAAHSISRLPPLLIMRFYDYARSENSKSKGAIYKPTSKELIFSSLMALLPMLGLPIICLISLLPLGIITYGLARYFYNYIGGYTGDCLGAIQQIDETLFYLTVSALWKFT